MKRDFKHSICLLTVLIIIFILATGCGRRARAMKEDEVKNTVLNRFRSEYFGTEFTEFDATVSSIDSFPKEGYTNAELNVSIGDGNDTIEESCAVYFTLDDKNEWQIESMNRTVSSLDPDDVQSYFEDHVASSYPECNFTEYTVSAWIDAEDDSADYGYANVSASAHAENDEISLNVDYTGNCYLDKYKHWQMGDLTVQYGDYTVLKSDLTESEALEAVGEDPEFDLDKYYDIVLKSHELDSEANKDHFFFTAKRRDQNNVEHSRELDVVFGYRLYSGWEYKWTDIVGSEKNRKIVVSSDPYSMYR